MGLYIHVAGKMMEGRKKSSHRKRENEETQHGRSRD